MYSFSQIELYQQCPKKYQYKYVDKLETVFKNSPDLILGTSVHGALERLYQQVTVFKIPTSEEVLTKFHEIRTEEENKAWEELLFKWYQTKEDYLTRGEQYLTTYYEKNTPFNQTKIIGTETKLYFQLTDEPEKKDQTFYGIIDRLDQDGAETFVINDYKTNKNLPPENDHKYQEQLNLYALGVQQKYGKYFKKMKARLHFLHFWIIDEREINEEILTPIKEKYITLIAEIEQAKRTYAESLLTDKNAFPVKENEHCKYCEYQTCCPLYKHLSFEDTSIDGGMLWESTIKKLIDQYVKLTQEVNFKKKEIENLKELLVDYAIKNEIMQLFGEEETIGLSQTYNYSAKDKEQLKQFLLEKNLLDKAVDLPYYKLNALVKENALNPEEIQTYLEKNDVWTLRPKKKKEE